MSRQWAHPHEPRVNFVSIGANCLPKLALTRSGLLAAGAPTMPLDLCLSTDNGALQAVITNFEGLTDPARLSWDRQGNCPRNVDLEIVFCHERGQAWCANHHAALNARYQKRIERFRDTLRNGQDTVFVYASHSRFSEETRQLLLVAADRLCRQTAGNSAVLALVTGACELDLAIVEDASVRFLPLPFPRPDYVFHDPKDYSSHAGRAFERAIASAATDLASFLCYPAEPAVRSDARINSPVPHALTT